MAKVKQGSISLKRECYRKLKAEAERLGVSMASIVESEIARFFEEECDNTLS